MTESILEQFFGSPEAPNEALSLNELDGYLTAIVIGPELIMPSEWFPGLWRGEEVSGFKDTTQAREVLGAVMARYAEIIRQLNNSPQEYRPLYVSSEPNERPSSKLAGEWAQGFWQAMLLRRGDWGRLIHDRKARVMLAPIMCFIRDEEGNHMLNAQDEELDDLMIDAGTLIPQVVPAIRDYWRSRSSKAAPPARAGRNDPCPCGSGRKFKRCCGAT